MTQESTVLLIRLGAGADADSEELDELAHQLRDDLNQLDEVSAELATGGELPKGAKGEPLTIGAILVKLAKAGGITGLLAVLGSWLSRDERRTVTLQIGENKLEVTGISKVEQARLIEWFQTQAGLQMKV
jgi:hypothetical protein